MANARSLTDASLKHSYSMMASYTNLTTAISPVLSGYHSADMNEQLQKTLWENDRFVNIPISQLYNELFDIFKKGHPDGGTIIQTREQLKLILQLSSRIEFSPNESKKLIDFFKENEKEMVQATINRLLIRIQYQCNPVGELKKLLEQLKDLFLSSLGSDTYYSLRRHHDGSGIPMIEELGNLIPLIELCYNEDPEKSNIAKLNLMSRIPSMMAVNAGKKNDIFTGRRSTGSEKISINYTYSLAEKELIEKIVGILNAMTPDIKNDKTNTVLNTPQNKLNSHSTSAYSPSSQTLYTQPSVKNSEQVKPLDAAKSDSVAKMDKG